MSPKAQRPMRGSKTMSSPSSRPIEVSTSPSGKFCFNGWFYKFHSQDWWFNCSPLSRSAASRVYTPLSPKSVSSTSSMDSSSQASTPDSRPAAETNVIKPSSPKAATPATVGEGEKTSHRPLWPSGWLSLHSVKYIFLAVEVIGFWMHKSRDFLIFLFL